MKLTKENIDFIDTYLKNSGVEYLDIRYEMIDHVATAIEREEGDFLEKFRLYMARNKKYIMQSNKQFAKTARKRALRLLLQNMIKPRSIVFIATLFLVFRLSVNVFGVDIVKEVLSISYSLLSVGLIIFYKVIGYNNFKFSVLDKLISILLIISYALFVLLRPDKLLNDATWIIVYYTVLTSFVAINVYTYYSLSVKYKLRYELS